MEVIVLDSEAYKQLTQEIKAYVKEALREFMLEQTTSHKSDWICLSEAQKLLPLKSKTSWQKLRDNATIRFTQSGRTIMYSRKSIHDYLNKNQI